MAKRGAAPERVRAAVACDRSRLSGSFANQQGHDVAALRDRRPAEKMVFQPQCHPNGRHEQQQRRCGNQVCSHTAMLWARGETRVRRATKVHKDCVRGESSGGGGETVSDPRFGEQIVRVARVFLDLLT